MRAEIVSAKNNKISENMRKGFELTIDKKTITLLFYPVLSCLHPAYIL